MKNKLMLFSCIFVLLLSSTVFAIEGLYVSGNIGPSILSDSDIDESEAGTTLSAELEFETGLTGGAAIGYDFGMGRLEAAVDYKSHDLDEWKDVTLTGYGNQGDFSGSGEITALSVLVNGYYDIENESPVTPYISGGIGFATVEIDDFEIEGYSVQDDSEDDTVFAYQLGVGIGFDVNEKITLDLAYRFFATNELDFDGVDAEYQSHNFIAGIRIGLY